MGVGKSGLNLQKISELLERDPLELDLSNKSLTFIPSEIIDILTPDIISQLNSLNLCYNKLKSISPLSHISFISLHSLDLSNNLFEDFEQIIQPISSSLSLQKLNVSHNYLSFLSFSSLTSLSSFSSLLTIDLTSNILKWIDQDINNIISLEKLSLRNNILNSIPDIFLPRLSFLDCSYNQISKLPKIFFKESSNLIHLNLSHNQLTEILNTFNNQTFPFLLHLDLSYNHISFLPDNFFSLSSLERLYLHYNRIFFLSAKQVSLLPKLSILDLYHNPVYVAYKVKSNDADKVINFLLQQEYISHNSHLSYISPHISRRRSEDWGDPNIPLSIEGKDKFFQNSLLSQQPQNINTTKYIGQIKLERPLSSFEQPISFNSSSISQSKLPYLTSYQPSIPLSRQGVSQRYEKLEKKEKEFESPDLESIPSESSSV